MRLDNSSYLHQESCWPTLKFHIRGPGVQAVAQNYNIIYNYKIYALRELKEILENDPMYNCVAD